MSNLVSSSDLGIGEMPDKEDDEEDETGMTGLMDDWYDWLNGCLA